MGKIWLVVLLVGISAHAEADVLCKKSNGAVVVRAACTNRQMQLNPVTLGLQGPAGPGAVVKDSNAAFVGTMFTEQNVIRQGQDVGVLVHTDSEGFVEDLFQLYYESLDCTGPGFLTQSDTLSSLLRHGFVRGATVFYASESTVTVTERSYAESPRQQIDCPTSTNQFFIPPNICCSHVGPQSVELYPTQQLDLSSLIPPFHVEVSE